MRKAMRGLVGRLGPGIKLAVVAAVVLLLARSLGGADWSLVEASLRRVGPLAALILVPFPLGLLLEALAWRSLLARVDADVPLARLFRTRIATEALASVLPAGALVAEGVGPFLLVDAAPLESTLAAGAAKRWLVLRAHGMFVLLATALGLPGLLARSGALPGGVALPAIAVACGLGLLVASVVIERSTARLGLAQRARAMVRRLQASTLLGRLVRVDVESHAFERVDGKLGELGGSWHLAPCGLLLAQWLVEAATTWLILRVLGVELAFVDALTIEAALGVVRNAVAFAPSGVGVQDLGYLAFLPAYGVPDAAAVGAAFLVLKRAKELVYIALGAATLAALAAPSVAGRRAGRAAASLGATLR
jgi:uncharacterized membrane protein YbhN (UPF0104 family)